METNLFLFIHELLPTSGALLLFFKVITWFGSSLCISIIVIFSATFLLFRGRFHKAHIILLAGIMAGITSALSKYIVRRPRPDLWSLATIPANYSFPSGHALITVAVYGTIAYFLAEHYPQKRRLIYICCGIFLFLIGFSRIYLGLHWPTDVVGGWTIGFLLFLALIWWYKKGGFIKAVRWGIGFVALFLGLIGLIIPIIPGIPLLIAAFLLIFSDKSLADMFKKKEKPKVEME